MRKIFEVVLMSKFLKIVKTTTLVEHPEILAHVGALACSFWYWRMAFSLSCSGGNPNPFETNFAKREVGLSKK
jgi:hypothetical protein